MNTPSELLASAGFVKLPAIYARFSSDRQREASIDDQVRRCREYIERMGGNAATALVFADHAVSGSSLERPAFEALLRAVDDGRIQYIVAEDLSRISRDVADAARVFRQLEFARVPLISISDGIDTSSKSAKLPFTFKSVFAEIYIDELRDKTLRGLEGRALGGFATGAVPYGYRTRMKRDARGRDLGSVIRIVEREAQVVRRIFAEYLDGRSLAQIAHRLNADGVPSPRVRMRHRRAGWSMGTIRAMLYNERYAGTWRFKEREWVKVPGTNRRMPRRRPLERGDFVRACGPPNHRRRDVVRRSDAPPVCASRVHLRPEEWASSSSRSVPAFRPDRL